jgi:hypothetical protein
MNDRTTGMNSYPSPSFLTTTTSTQQLPKEMANEFIDRMKSTLDEARAALQKSKDNMARYYN